jgi:phage I-like protein
MKIMIICFLTFLKNLLTSNLTALANTAKESIGLVGLVNRFESGSDGFVQLSPFGDFQHAKGVQRIDRAAGEAMANHFNKISSKLARLFLGVPFYIGHPDVAGLANEYPDRKAYGWVKALEVREDGLYGKVDWSTPGKELLENAHFKSLSPYFQGEPIGFEKGKQVFRPVELTSVGLTNHPNLPVNPLANEAETESKIMEKALLIALLGLANEANEEQIKTKITSLVNSQNETATVRTSLSNEVTAHSTTKGNLTSLENQFKAERRERCVLLVNEAIREGRVAPEKKDEWVTKLEKDFEAGKTALANEVRSGRAIKTEARTREQGGRRSGFANISDAREQFDALVNEKVRAGIDFDTAYNTVKKQKPELYKSMSTPERSED